MLACLLAITLLAGTPPARGARKPAVLREAPGDALFREAKALRYAQRYFEAADLYRRYLGAFPQGSRVPDARFWLAATLELDQRWDEAADAYTDFLQQHPDQRMLGKEARLNRIRCWGIRQGQHPMATPGLLGALQDGDLDVQVAAALQLAKRGDRRAVPVLQKGLELPAFVEACSAALNALGVKAPQADRSHQARFLVIRIREAGKAEPVCIRIALSIARTLDNYLSDEQVRQVRRKGVDLESISDQAARLPKGSVLLSVDDKRSTVTVTVE